ncbi:MAG: tetratricopeptide repeat protein [Nitrospirota bacterium]|nr:tetratricopeptide repeat protein [Nitrospirota bacterium]
MADDKLLHDAQRLLSTGKHSESIDRFSEYIVSGGEGEAALLGRGIAYLCADQADNAIRDFGAVIRMDTQNFLAYFYRGTAFIAREDYKEAVADLDRTLELRPDHGPAYLARGAVYAILGNKYEASRNIRTAMKLSYGQMHGLMLQDSALEVRLDRSMDFIRRGKGPDVITLTDDQTVRSARSVRE